MPTVSDMVKAAKENKNSLSVGCFTASTEVINLSTLVPDLQNGLGSAIGRVVQNQINNMIQKTKDALMQQVCDVGNEMIAQAMKPINDQISKANANIAGLSLDSLVGSQIANSFGGNDKFSQRLFGRGGVSNRWINARRNDYANKIGYSASYDPFASIKASANQVYNNADTIAQTAVNNANTAVNSTMTGITTPSPTVQRTPQAVQTPNVQTAPIVTAPIQSSPSSMGDTNRFTGEPVPTIAPTHLLVTKSTDWINESLTAVHAKKTISNHTRQHDIGGVVLSMSVMRNATALEYNVDCDEFFVRGLGIEQLFGSTTSSQSNAVTVNTSQTALSASLLSNAIAKTSEVQAAVDQGIEIGKRVTQAQQDKQIGRGLPSSIGCEAIAEKQLANTRKIITDDTVLSQTSAVAASHVVSETQKRSLRTQVHLNDYCDVTESAQGICVPEADGMGGADTNYGMWASQLSLSKEQQAAAQNYIFNNVDPADTVDSKCDGG